MIGFFLEWQPIMITYAVVWSEKCSHSSRGNTRQYALNPLLTEDGLSQMGITYTQDLDLI